MSRGRRALIVELKRTHLAAFVLRPGLEVACIDRAGLIGEVSRVAMLLATNYGVQLLQTLGALLIVCALAFVVLRVVSRRGLGQLGGQRMQLEATLALGPRQRIAIVRVDGVELLVGIGDQGISLLRELPERIDEATTIEATEARRSFAARLLKKSA